MPQVSESIPNQTQLCHRLIDCIVVFSRRFMQARSTVKSNIRLRGRCCTGALIPLRAQVKAVRCCTLAIHYRLSRTRHHIDYRRSAGHELVKQFFIQSVGVAQQRGPPERPERRVLLHGALEVDHEDYVAVRPGRVLVAGALEGSLGAEHLALHLHLFVWGSRVRSIKDEGSVFFMFMLIMLLTLFASKPCCDPVLFILTAEIILSFFGVGPVHP